MPSQPSIARDEAGIWRRRAGELALVCAGSFAADEGARLRDTIALLRAAPSRVAEGLALPDPVRLEALLGAGAALAGVVDLFAGVPAGYLLSRGASGQHLASVILPGRAEEISAGGESAALALLGALALALAEPAPDLPLPLPRRASPGLRLN